MSLHRKRLRYFRIGVHYPTPSFNKGSRIVCLQSLDPFIWRMKISAVSLMTFGMSGDPLGGALGTPEGLNQRIAECIDELVVHEWVKFNGFRDNNLCLRSSIFRIWFGMISPKVNAL